MSFLKQMINAIARTFGRIIAYAIIAAIIAIVGSKIVGAQGQYRMSDLTNSWTDWENISIGTDYGNSTNITTSWGSYIQLKDTTVMESNKTYNFNTSLKITIIGQGDRELFSSIVPYIYNGTTLTDVSDKCSMSGTKSDSTTSGLLPQTTHIYNANINCVGLKGTGYYPYITIRFKANTNTLLTTERINVSSWNYSVGTDSTDANNIMNNANQNTENIIEANNQNTESIINNQNQNTQEITNAIQNQYNVCSNRTILGNDYIGRENYALGENNNEVFDTGYKITEYINITSNQTYTLSGLRGNANSYCLYDENFNYSCTRYNGETSLTFNSGNYTKIRWTVRNNVNTYLDGTFCYDYREKESEESEKQTNLLVQIGQGIIGLPDSIGNVFSDLLTYLFVPDDFDFSDEILTPLETKLGFIAEIPIQILTWLINLPNVNYDEFTGFTFPAFSFMDYSFWESQYIDITDIRDVIAPYKIYTSLTCVVICINTLYRHYHNFANGGE